VYEIHGHLREMTCIYCFRAFPADHHINRFLETNTMPRCPDCGNALKPNIILFGEQLPTLALSAARREARRCDVMLVVGSSLEVYPAADLPILAHRSGASVILVNRDSTPIDDLAQVTIHADAVDILPKLANALLNE
jgi:NAD-dependent deacetylase